MAAGCSLHDMTESAIRVIHDDYAVSRSSIFQAMRIRHDMDERLVATSTAFT